MVKYSHVKAIRDVYSHRGDIVCFADEIYKIKFVDEEYGYYHVECEPEIGGFPVAIGIRIDDEDFEFLEEVE